MNVYIILITLLITVIACISLLLIRQIRRQFEVWQKAQQKTFSDSIQVKSITLEEPTAPVTDYFNSELSEQDKKLYYSEIDMANASSLFDSLNKLLTETHRTLLQYKPSLHLYPLADIHEDGLLRSIYSGKTFDLRTILAMDAEIDEQIATEIRRLGLSNLTAEEHEEKTNAIKQKPYNCEHVVPQAWFKEQEPMKGDLHHLFTCEVNCNNFRANSRYHEFTDYGMIDITNTVKSDCGKLEEGLFEPQINKGIVSRAVLYFFIRYPNAILSGKGYNAADIPSLIKWHNDNPVSIYELHRNEVIYNKQGNRNPFIDFPELADKLNFESHVEAMTVTPNTEDDIFAEVGINLALATCTENTNPKPWVDWRTAESLKQMLKQINTMAPSRNKASDGTIGDTAHQSRDSDHNPWVWDEVSKKGVVTALDVTHDPVGKCDCNILVNSLVNNKDVRIKYVIWNKRIANSSAINGAPAWTWRPYGGTNPHDKHVHISVKCEKEHYDSISPWSVSVR